MKRCDVLIGDIAGLFGLGHDVLIVGQRDELHPGLVEGLGGHGEAVSVAGHHAHHLEAGLSQGFYGLERAAAGGDQVLNDHHFGPCGQCAFDEIAHAVVLGLGADVAERQCQRVGHEGALGDGAGGNTGYGRGLGEVFEDGMDEARLDHTAQIGVGKRLAVVAIER